MKSDKLNSIFEHTDFDVFEPKRNHEDRFLKKMHLKTVQRKNRYLWIAAACTILSIGIWFGTQIQQPKIQLADVSTKMKEAENHFISTISFSIKELQKKENKNTKTIINDGLEQIKILEKSYQKLLVELNKNHNQEQIVFALITNYQQRIEVLQNILKKIKELKNINHENKIL